MTRMRGFSIGLIVASALVIIGSIGLAVHNLFQIYGLTGACTTDPCEQAVVRQLEKKEQYNTYTRVALFGGCVMLVAAIIAYRKMEDKTSKANTRSKSVY